MNRNSILFCCTEFPPLPGGIGNHAFGLSKELAKSNNLTIITELRGSNKDFFNFAKINLPTVKFIAIKWISLSIVTYTKRILSYLSVRKKSKIHFFSGRFYIWIAVLKPKHCNGIAVIHGGEIKLAGLFKKIFQLGLNNCNSIVCVSNYTRDRLNTLYSIPVSKIRVINNGFIPSQLNTPNFPKFIDSKIRLITVGGIHKRKGQQNVINALPNLLSFFPELQYYLIGIPVELNDVYILANSNSTLSSIIYSGVVDDIEKWNILSQSHIFIMLSDEISNDFEGFGIAVIEAMSIGIPAIGSINCGIADAIKDKFSGRLVDPHSPSEILNAVIDIYNNFNFYSNNAIEWSQSFKWETIVLKYKSLCDA
jgi:phosphatidylinositol alpha-1,6-mannosyltransferase